MHKTFVMKLDHKAEEALHCPHFIIIKRAAADEGIKELSAHPTLEFALLGKELHATAAN